MELRVAESALSRVKAVGWALNPAPWEGPRSLRLLSVFAVALGLLLGPRSGLYEHRLQRDGRTPRLNLGLFKQRTFSAGLAAQLALSCGQASFFLVLALYLQNGRGLSALHSGVVFAILAAAYLAASLRAPALTLRHGRRIVAIGALTLALGHAALLLAVDRIGTGGTIATLAPGLLLVGAGMGLCITPLTTTVLASADPHHGGAVSGTLSKMQQLGNSLGVAITGVIFFDTLRARSPARSPPPRCRGPGNFGTTIHPTS